MSLQLPLPVGLFQPNRSFDKGPHDAVRSTVFELARRFWYSMRRCWWAALWHLEVEGAEHVPAHGPVLLCANHVSHLDAPAILAALPRATALRTSTAAAKDVFGDKPARNFVSRLLTNATPIERHAGDDSGKGFARGLRELDAVLDDRRPLILFPEGRRSPDGKLVEFKLGAAMLALRTGAPIVPIHIRGAFQALPRKSKLPRPADIRVRFGKPIDPRPYRASVAAGRMTKRVAYVALTHDLKAAIEGMDGD
jgi:1-acyl-sn-glycerol-3-phosphate acyltransferase